MTRWTTLIPAKPGDEEAVGRSGRQHRAAMRARVARHDRGDRARGARRGARAPRSRRGSASTRHGYRHGTRARTLTTSLGPTTFAMPRARMQQADGTTRRVAQPDGARYQRRTERVDEAILGVYLAGDEHAADQGRAGAAAAGRAACRRMRSRGWWAGCARTSRRGAAGISPTRTSGTCSWTAGIRRCASGDAACACRCW